jgi:hypothetical protein
VRPLLITLMALACATPEPPPKLSDVWIIDADFSVADQAAIVDAFEQWATATGGAWAPSLVVAPCAFRDYHCVAALTAGDAELFFEHITALDPKRLPRGRYALAFDSVWIQPDFAGGAHTHYIAVHEVGHAAGFLSHLEGSVLGELIDPGLPPCISMELQRAYCERLPCGEGARWTCP